MSEPARCSEPDCLFGVITWGHVQSRDKNHGWILIPCKVCNPTGYGRYLDKQKQEFLEHLAQHPCDHQMVKRSSGSESCRVCGIPEEWLTHQQPTCQEGHSERQGEGGVDREGREDGAHAGDEQ